MTATPAKVAELAQHEARQAEARADPWGDAQPLHRDLPPSAPYPKEALGDILGPACDVLIYTIQPPLATAAQSTLAAASLATQGHADVLMDGREIPPSLFLVSVLESGGRKSSTDRTALAPHYRREKTLALTYKVEREHFEARKLAWEKSRDDVVRHVKGTAGKEEALLALGPRPEEPVAPQLLTDEPTWEGLCKQYQIGSPSMGLLSDEGGRLLGGHAMKPENRLAMLSGLSSLWDGKRLTRTRAGEGSTVLYSRRMTLHLMLQPIVAPALLGDPLAAEQGFLSRTLVSWPDSNLGSQPYVAVDPAEDPRFLNYTDRMRELLERPLPTSPTDPRQLLPRLLPLSEPAKTTWVHFHDWIQRHLGPEGALRPIAPFAAKAAEHALRLAGVLTLVDTPDAARLNLAAVERGIVLARYYLDEALRLQGVGTTAKETLDAERLLAWMRGRGQLVALPDVYQLGPASVRDKATAVKLLDLLEAHGWVRKLERGAEVGGQRRRDVWEVRP